MSKEPLVSVIIPCFNSEKFISETITSVLKQSFQTFEIIFVNDGSTDRSGEIISQFNDPRIIQLNKSNSGVSDTRNKGLEHSKGSYVLFLDADDVLSPDFLEKRVQFLVDHPMYGFCFSSIIKIDEWGAPLSDAQLDGAGTNILQEILSYDLNFSACPSNYLFRKDILMHHKVKFDIELSSSADRYFLVELSRFTEGLKIEEGGHLFYRVHTKSMSHLLTLNLLHDNITFQKKILQLGYIPEPLRKIFSFKTNYIFAGSYFKLNKYVPFTFFFLKAFCNNPVRLLKKIIKKK